METVTADDLKSSTTWVDPYPVYRELRPRSPIAIEFGGERAFALLAFRHVFDVLRDHATFSSDVGPPFASDAVLIRDHPPLHTRLRATVNKAFTPRQVASFEPWILRLANELLHGLIAPEVDTVAALTMPLPVRVIAILLGVPEQDYRQFKSWSDRVTRGDANAGEELGLYIAEIAIRRDRSSEDLLGALIDAEVDGRHLDLRQLLGFAALLLIAGNETTTNLMSNMLSILAGRPDLWSRLQTDRSLVEPFIEEALRFQSPVQLVYRRARHDTQIDGVDIPAGSALGIYFGAANRDPDEFADPDEFRLDRELSSHLAFGHGIHFCLGAPPAKLEARITLNGLLDRFVSIEPSSAPGKRLDASPNLYGFESLPLRMRRR